jgi:hypothetical protein
MLDLAVIIRLGECGCCRAANENVTPSSASEGSLLSKSSKFTLMMTSIVGNICCRCRSGLWLLVRRGWNYAQH